MKDYLSSLKYFKCLIVKHIYLILEWWTRTKEHTQSNWCVWLTTLSNLFMKIYSFVIPEKFPTIQSKAWHHSQKFFNPVCIYCNWQTVRSFCLLRPNIYLNDRKQHAGNHLEQTLNDIYPLNFQDNRNFLFSRWNSFVIDNFIGKLMNLGTSIEISYGLICSSRKELIMYCSILLQKM